MNGQIYIEELFPPSGGNKGSNYINKLFMEKVLKGIFDQNAINKLLQIIKKIQQMMMKLDMMTL